MTHMLGTYLNMQDVNVNTGKGIHKKKLYTNAQIPVVFGKVI